MRFPEQKDIVIIDAEPHSGKEYGGHSPEAGNVRRHMVVVNSSSYTRATSMILAMTITTSTKYNNNPRYLPILLAGGKKMELNDLLPCGSCKILILFPAMVKL